MIRDAIGNPRTSIAGLAVLALSVALVMGRISVDQFVGAFGVVAGGGFLMARDARRKP